MEYEENEVLLGQALKRDSNKVPFIKKHKFICSMIVITGIAMIINISLIYQFVRALETL